MKERRKKVGKRGSILGRWRERSKTKGRKEERKTTAGKKEEEGGRRGGGRKGRQHSASN